MAPERELIGEELKYVRSLKPVDQSQTFFKIGAQRAKLGPKRAKLGPKRAKAQICVDKSRFGLAATANCWALMAVTQ